MEKLAAQQSEQKKDWDLTQERLSRLLRWLDCGVDSQGQRYNLLYGRIVNYFDRRQCHCPEELATETFERITKFLENNAKEYDAEPAKLLYTTAGFVLKKYLDKRRPEQLDRRAHEPFVDPVELRALEEERETEERRLACLKRCEQALIAARNLSAEDVAVALRYYDGEGRARINNRKALAAERGMSENALRKRVCDTRRKLGDCVTGCMAKGPAA